MPRTENHLISKAASLDPRRESRTQRLRRIPSTHPTPTLRTSTSIHRTTKHRMRIHTGSHLCMRSRGSMRGQKVADEGEDLNLEVARTVARLRSSSSLSNRYVGGLQSIVLIKCLAGSHQEMEEREQVHARTMRMH